jgi:L-asparaginase/Glu-tRNA(Gln) amidotransferase subunit D
MKDNNKYDQKVQKDLIGKITYHEQLNVDSKNRGIEPPSNKKVFILLTGGTIGMFPNAEGKYAPAQDRFISFLKKYQYFCD